MESHFDARKVTDTVFILFLLVARTMQTVIVIWFFDLVAVSFATVSVFVV
jgi:hypothetical protein